MCRQLTLQMPVLWMDLKHRPILFQLYTLSLVTAGCRLLYMKHKIFILTACFVASKYGNKCWIKCANLTGLTLHLI